MKKIFSLLSDYLQGLLSGRQEDRSVTVRPQQAIEKVIKTALQDQSAVHVIYGEKNFTGDIVKYDQDKAQLIVRNFKGSVTMIIHLEEIKKISILPDSIKKSQHLSSV